MRTGDYSDTSWDELSVHATLPRALPESMSGPTRHYMVLDSASPRQLSDPLAPKSIKG